MKKSLLIGIAALAVLSLWLVVLFGHDSPTTNVSFTPPVYAQNDSSDNGGGTLDGCTDSCLYEPTIATLLPYLPGYCKLRLWVKHKEYDTQNCCCHEAGTIVVRIWQDCDDFDEGWLCSAESSGGVGQLCQWTRYETPFFVVKDNVRFHYMFQDSACTTSCICTGYYTVDCE